MFTVKILYSHHSEKDAGVFYSKNMSSMFIARKNSEKNAPSTAYPAVLVLLFVEYVQDKNVFQDFLYFKGQRQRNGEALTILKGFSHSGWFNSREKNPFTA